MNAWVFVAGMFGFAGVSAVAENRLDEREAMVEDQLRARNITDERVLAAMSAVPRHELMPEAVRAAAYADGAQPIGFRQTISQPYIVALMTQLLDVQADARVLEIGTGSGYQAAVLAEILKGGGGHVFSIEIIEPLAERAKADLQRLGYSNVTVRAGDGYAGWPEEAPFDAIVVTAAPPEIPAPLVEQLRDGGRMVVPVGRGVQELVVLEKSGGKLHRRQVAPVRFVPMTGEAQRGD